MNIEIRKLTPDLAEDYVRLFDVTPHGDFTDKNVCYCVTWRNDDTYVGNGDHWYPTREERRERALKYVKSGSIQGYLAYRGDRIVGWCNASADCQDAAADGFNFVESYANKEFTDPLNEMRGTLTMYEKCGFSKCAEREDNVVMRKVLEV